MDQDRDSLDLPSVNDSSESELVPKHSRTSPTNSTATVSTSGTGLKKSFSDVKKQVARKISSLKRVNSSVESSAGLSATSGLKTDDPFNEVGQALRNLYHKVVEPIEKTSNFQQMVSQPYDDAEFEAKPLVLLIGQYSTGN